RPLIIGLAVSPKAKADLEGWYEPAYLRFVARHGLFAKTHRAEAWFVPLFTGLNKAAYEPSLRRFRRSAAPEAAQRVVFAKADLDELRAALGIGDETVPYFFVVDPQGRIVHRVSGKHTDDKLDALEEVLFGL
ncbi:MAG: TlpA family protein disulfide reductase, partial [Flavobacteriales bacterium]